MSNAQKVVFVIALALWPALVHAVTIGEPIPSFRLPELSDTGTSYSPDDFKGKVMLLTVWASWCHVCRNQMPEMIKLQRELGPKGLAVVAISIDDDSRTPREYLKKLEAAAGPLNFKVLHDRNHRVAEGLGHRGVPNNWIVSRDGAVVQVIRGGFDAKGYKPMRQLLLAALAGRPVAGWDGDREASGETKKAKPRAPFKIDPTRVLVDGGLERQAVARALERDWTEFRACHEAAIEKRPGLSGDVLVRFVVDEKGHVEKAVVEQSYVNYEPLEECLVRAVSKCTFPPPKAGKATVRYPFVFRSDMSMEP